MKHKKDNVEDATARVNLRLFSSKKKGELRIWTNACFSLSQRGREGKGGGELSIPTPTLIRQIIFY